MDIKKYENLSKAGKDSVKKYLYLLTKKEKKKFDFTDLFFLRIKAGKILKTMIRIFITKIFLIKHSIKN